MRTGVAELEDGSPAPEGTPDGDLLFPQCHRAAPNSAPFRSPAWRPDSERLASVAELGNETAPM